jgi:hypothetical protein
VADLALGSRTVTRQELEHLIRAAAQIADDDEIVVIGSQSILGRHPDAPRTMRVSMEADLYPKNHPERSDVIDGAIGELSAFHETFGYYAQGVGPDTATLPRGWETRLVRSRMTPPAGARRSAMTGFRIVIASYPDRDELVAEVSHAGAIFAYVSQPAGAPTKIELFGPPPGSDPEWWTFDYDEFLLAIGAAAKEITDLEDG